MSSLLHLNRRSAMRCYQQIVKSICVDMPDDVDVRFSFNDLNNSRTNRNFNPFRKTYGSTHVVSDDLFSVMLDGKSFGMGNYWNDPFWPVSDQDFVDGVMTLCHEMQHVRQHLACRGKLNYDSFSPDIAVSLISAHQNPYYYDLAYDNFLHEIDACAVGFITGYDVLLSQFADKLPGGQLDIDRLVMNHIRSDVGKTYTADFSRCTSVNDAARRLLQAYGAWYVPFARDKQKAETVILDNYDSDVMPKASLDEGYVVANKLSGALMQCVDQWQGAWGDFLHSCTMRDSCYRLCAISLKLHPQYADVYSCLESVQDDLSVSKLFPKVAGGEFLEQVDSIYKRVWDVSPKTRLPGCVGDNGFSDMRRVVDVPESCVVQPVPKPNRSVPEAVNILSSRTPNYGDIKRPQSCSGRSLCGLDVNPDNSNNVSNDFERS